jgi:hypothetical protein
MVVVSFTFLSHTWPIGGFIRERLTNRRAYTQRLLSPDYLQGQSVREYHKEVLVMCVEVR